MIDDDGDDDDDDDNNKNNKNSVWNRIIIANFSSVGIKTRL
jgi:hypothetical protein